MGQSKLAAVLLTAVLSLACGSEVSRNYTPGYQAPGEIRQHEPSVQPNRTVVTFLIDKTDSAADDILENRIEEIKTFLRGLQPSKVGVVSFGADGRSTWYAPEVTITLPTSEVPTFDETAVRQGLEKQCNFRRHCIDAELDKARSFAKTQAQADVDTYKTQLEQAIDKIVSAILRPPTAEPECSDFNEVGERITKTKSDIVILLSDGQHNCDSGLVHFDFSGRRVLVLLLPLKNSVRDQGFETRLKAIRTAFTGTSVVPLVTADAQDIADAVSEPKKNG